PIEYLEVFGSVEDHSLPFPRQATAGADHFDHMTLLGLHYHKDYLTPYWDPEGGYRVDLTYSNGLPVFGEQEAFYRLEGQLTYVKSFPAPLSWLMDTRVMVRLYGGVGLPNKGEYFALGGGDLFRGFDLRERQGSLIWVGTLEWRVPLVRGLTWD